MGSPAAFWHSAGRANAFAPSSATFVRHVEPRGRNPRRDPCGLEHDSAQYAVELVRHPEARADDAASRLFTAKVKMMLVLQHFPNQVFDLVSHAEKQCLGPSTGVAPDDSTFGAGAYICSNIDKAFRSAFLVKHFAPQGFTEEAVQNIDQKDPKSIMELVDFFACIGPNTRLHPTCVEKKCCEQFLLARIQQMGRLTSERVRALVKSDYGIDFVNHGCYKLHVAGDVTQVEHVDGARVNWPGQTLRIEGAHMVDKHNDHMAAIVIDSLTPIKLKTFYGPNEQEELGDQPTRARDTERRKNLERALGECQKSRVRVAQAKRRPAEPPAKKHRAMVGDLLQAARGLALAPLANGGEETSERPPLGAA